MLQSSNQLTYQHFSVNVTRFHNSWLLNFFYIYLEINYLIDLFSQKLDYSQMCITRSTPQLNPRNTVSTCTKKYDRELHRKCNCQRQPIFHHIKPHSLHSSRNTVIALVGIVSALSLQERVNFRGKTRQNIHCCRSRWRQTFCCSHDTRAWNGNQRFSSATPHCSFVRSNCR